MKKTIYLFTIILFFANHLFCQTFFKSKEFRFEMQEPTNWIVTSNETLVNNLQKIDFSDEKIKEMLETKNGSILLTSYYKYDQKTHAGLIPTIQVLVRTKYGKDYNEFKQSIIASNNELKNHFENYKNIINPTDTIISGIKCIYFLSSFTLKYKNGLELNVRSRTYAIPYKNYFFQINFTDDLTGEKCDNEFDALINTIKIGL